MYLDVMDGVVHCEECRKKSNLEKPREGHTAVLLPLDKPIFNAMRYVCYANAKRYLSFELSAELVGVFAEYCEKYLLNHLERSFRSLEFLHSLDLLPNAE